LAQTEDVENLNRSFQSELSQAKQEVEALKSALEASRQDALIDELTQIGNRRAFDQAIESALSDNKGGTHLLLMDLDHFKQCNDTYGHVMGDRVLERMGAILKAAASANVQVMRYGGEEFAAIVSGAQSEALEVAEGIRRKVGGIRITQVGSSDTLSISVGLASARKAEEASQLKVRADEALYQAKDTGRNRVCVSDSNMAITG